MARKIQKNDSSKPGSLAASKVLFGNCSRYAIAPVHTRFNDVSWFVWDAELTDEATGYASVIRQADTLADAMRGLENEPKACNVMGAFII